MKHTANQTEQQTLTAMYRAMDRHHPITITYTKADGTETIRTVELHSILTTKAGHIILRAADRQTGEMRTWRLDRIVSYTTHRTHYVVVLPETETPAVTPAPTTPAAIVAYELARDERPVTTRQLTPAA